ncbi:DEAD/DEAH box helicase [Paenibacillus eucommiae]|uniref:SNF2 family DNA or RNA helicase n=1 Tax=Paenibacillus eucommiae TaxID=1355755 RepID=A0ABS4ITG9_9BACL|nr:DEAD/DEAH box helicase [Paenibacillus eucommiae]MBP1990876.1 SNF2 family DNA or RNA helicase [Paenibacillus eucommiae]
MITAAKVQVYGEWSLPAGLSIWGDENPDETAETAGAEGAEVAEVAEVADRGTMDAAKLKRYLFAWHKKSYYGAFIELHKNAGKSALLLTPLQALDYFSNPLPVKHVFFQWDEEMVKLQQVAPLFKQVLDNGWLSPDFEGWKMNANSWRLQLPEDQQESVEAVCLSIEEHRDFLEKLLNVILSTSIEELLETYSGLKRISDVQGWLEKKRVQGGSDLNIWMDEEDWLTEIGWKDDGTPFRVCLQLVDPETGEEEWHFRVLLEDRNHPDLLRYYDPWSSGGAGFGLAQLETHEDDDAEAAYPDHWRGHEEQVFRAIKRWLLLHPGLQAESQEQLMQEISSEQAWEFMSSGSIRLVEAGYPVFLPAWWEQLVRAKPKLKAAVKSSVGSSQQSMFGLNQMIKFDWKVAVGDLELSEEEFRHIARKNQHLIQIRGNWIQLDPAFIDRVQQVMKEVAKKQGLSFKDVLELHLLQDMDHEQELGDLAEGASDRLHIEVELNRHLTGLIEQLQHSAFLPQIQAPASFQGKMRKYQQEGTSWLLFLRSFGLGGCLADDMGLGKTIQWIAYLLHIKESEPLQTASLLICPTSVLGNWQKELERFAPSMRIYLHYGPDRKKGEAFTAAIQGCDLVMTSYHLAYLDEHELSSVRWNCICLDEAQNIKNAYTKQSAAIRRLNGQHRIALTGTPIENRLTELWSIYDFINPGYLGKRNGFNKRFVHGIEKTKDPVLVGNMQQYIQPFLLRRLKNDPSIELDLPEKTESKVYVPLTLEQGTLYESVVNDMLAKVEKLSPMERRGLILSSLTRLKQICNHPSLVLKDAYSHGSPQRSAKMIRLLEMIGELRMEGDRCLIFTQFVEMGKLLQSTIERELGEKVMFMHGGSSKLQRDEMISRFQGQHPQSLQSSQPIRSPQHKESAVFILSLKTGGVGLNLTAANHVFHFDRWWNPAVENQATDRVYRIGQHKHVQVHKFVSLGTLEERIDEMLARKLELAEDIVGTGDKWITELSTDHLRDLLTLRRDWIEL